MHQFDFVTFAVIELQIVNMHSHIQHAFPAFGLLTLILEKKFFKKCFFRNLLNGVINILRFIFLWQISYV